MASGEMTKPAFTGFLASFMGHAVQYSQDGAIHFICMDWRHLGEVLDAATVTLRAGKNGCVLEQDQRRDGDRRPLQARE